MFVVCSQASRFACHHFETLSLDFNLLFIFSHSVALCYLFFVDVLLQVSRFPMAKLSYFTRTNIPSMQKLTEHVEELLKF